MLHQNKNNLKNNNNKKSQEQVFLKIGHHLTFLSLHKSNSVIWKSNINNTLCLSHSISTYKWSEVKYHIWKMLHNILKKDFNKNLKDAGMLFVESILDRILIIKAKPVFYYTEIMSGFWYGNMDEI